MYDENSIQRLKPMEHIRLRPTLYLTSNTASGKLHEVLFHSLDYPLDTAFEKRCQHIQVTLHKNNQATMTDDGEGMEVAIYKSVGVSRLELDVSEFPVPGRATYFYDCDIRLTNAFSDMFTAEVKRDGYLWRQEYRQGKKVTDVTQVRALKPDEGTGTTITFTPDFTILEPSDFDYPTIAKRLRELAFLMSGLTMTLRDERSNQQETVYYPNGLRDFVAYLNADRQPLHDIIHGSREVEVKPQYASVCNVKIEFALQYSEAADNRELNFANTTPMEGGTHLIGFRTALTRSINLFARQTGVLTEKDANFTRKEVARGLTAVVSVYHPHISFESQTRFRLINPELRAAVARVVSAEIAAFAQEHPEVMQYIVQKCLQSRAKISGGKI